MPGVEAADDAPLVGSLSLLAVGAGEASIEAGFVAIMLTGRLRGDLGRFVLAALGRKGTCRKVDVFLGDEVDLSGKADESVEGPAVGEDCAIVLPFAFGELA